MMKMQPDGAPQLDQALSQCEPKGSAAINISRRLFICRCGLVGRIDHFYNCNGQKTDDAEGAVTAVIELENGEWQYAVLSDFNDYVAVN